MNRHVAGRRACRTPADDHGSAQHAKGGRKRLHLKFHNVLLFIGAVWAPIYNVAICYEEVMRLSQLSWQLSV